MKLLKKVSRLITVIAVVVSYFSLTSLEISAQKYNMSYLYFGETASFIKKVDATNNSLDVVSPSYFDLFIDGSLDNKVDPIFVEEMHKAGVKVVPFLSNHWNRDKGVLALINREALVEQLVQVINEYQLDGINIDLENLTFAERNAYVDFIRLLRENLAEEIEVSVAVAANPYGSIRDWQGSYDYQGLAYYADYLMLMTYDESYYGSSPGPVASIGFVEKSIQFALSEVPPEKLVLGIPFYGRYWKDGQRGGRGISLTDVEKLVKQFNGKVYFAEQSKSPYAKITIPSGKYAYVNGIKLTAGKYTIWFENDLSLKYKLRLVEKYNLMGTGSWSLNQAPDQIWNYYTSWLNGQHYFVDTENHWAELDINATYQRGWMLGTAEGQFAPNKSLTRAEATVVLVRALGLENLSSNNLSGFSDVGASSWAREEIEIAFQNGLVSGTSPGYFSPSKPLTRAEMAALLNRILKFNDSVIADNPFSDLSTSHWAYSDILQLNNNKIFMGYNDGGFHPNDVITRGQMAVLMNRIANDIVR